ncbi:unnamed protein product, partial [Discosporangium mesarthrocarpum]
MADELSLIFHEPVDTELYPSYLEKIDDPMDLGTIKGKLERWQYRRNDPHGFARDVRLVWHNCKVYNKQGSNIWNTAAYLHQKFERLFQAWVVNFADKDDRLPWDDPAARPWEDACRRCEKTAAAEMGEMLLCDTCDAEYHCTCLGLTKVPKGQWLCPRCQDQLHKGHTLYSHAMEEELATRTQEPEAQTRVIQVQKYLVKWSNLSYQFCTWETREEINDDGKIEEFHRLNDHPPLSPPMSEEEVMKTLSRANHDVLPALRVPDTGQEYNAHIYCQVRAFHFLRYGVIPPLTLMRECGKPCAAYAQEKTPFNGEVLPTLMPVKPEESRDKLTSSRRAETDGTTGQMVEEKKTRDQVANLLFDMKESLALGRRYQPPNVDGVPPIPMHRDEYEVTIMKEGGSLFMNINEDVIRGTHCVYIQLLMPRPPPREHEPTPVMKTYRVEPQDIITAINGRPTLGLETVEVAEALRKLPTCVMLRLLKTPTGDTVPEVAATQALYLKEFMAIEEAKKIIARETATSVETTAGGGQGVPLVMDMIKPVLDHHTVAVSAGASSEMDMTESEHRAIEDLGLKRRLLMAVNEAKNVPAQEDWDDVDKIYSLSDYVYTHETAQGPESLASRRRDPRAKPIEQLDPATGHVVKVWPSMTAASAALFVGVSALSACVNGTTSSAGRWKWRFASKVTASALKMGVYRKSKVHLSQVDPQTYRGGQPEGAAAAAAAANSLSLSPRSSTRSRRGTEPSVEDNEVEVDIGGEGGEGLPGELEGKGGGGSAVKVKA